MRSPLLSVLLVGVLALSGCAAADPAPTVDPTVEAGADAGAEAGADCDGIGVVVDFGALDADGASSCVDATSATAATATLDDAGVTTEGSVEWGDAIVCRVNDRPGPDETVEVAGEASFVESCQSMPPAYAYWALWVKTSADAEWEYAQEGLGTLELEPGQSIGLVYTTGTETPTPAG
ncbi:hypothetical protein ACFCVO_00450 [Agromyces sp. NPDC056379]|uniref:hypothetical protein n=1 Tax=unclassified Agromyces TaxID=2639701 RepID=UPI0035DCB642